LNLTLLSHAIQTGMTYEEVTPSALVRLGGWPVPGGRRGTMCDRVTPGCRARLSRAIADGVTGRPTIL
jgi:hypothetical protein